MTGKREKTKQRNRAIILRSARECFLEHGYDDVTVRDIIRATGLASGTFYNYFEDKPAVFNALLDEVFVGANTALGSIRRTARNAEEMIRLAYQLLFQIIDDDPQLLNFALSTSAAIKELHDPERVVWSVKSLEEDLKVSANAGIIADTRLDYLAAYLFGQGYEVARMYASKRVAGGPSEAKALSDYMGAIGYDGFCVASATFAAAEKQLAIGENPNAQDNTQGAEAPA